MSGLEPRWIYGTSTSYAEAKAQFDESAGTVRLVELTATRLSPIERVIDERRQS